MHETIENIIKKWLKKHKDGGQWVSDYDGEFDLENCCLDGNFDLNDLADEVLKVVVEKIINGLNDIPWANRNECENEKVICENEIIDLLSNLSPNKENKNNE